MLNNFKNKKSIIIASFAWIALVAGIVAVASFAGIKKEQAIGLDAFAQCLTSRGAIMYGAYWCPHCQNEKAAFGDSFKFINYVECTKETQKCIDQGIKGYPTWIFSDGRRLEGEQGLEGLAEASACEL